MNIIKKTLAILAIIGLAACSDFGDMNQNPNAPTEINNNPELLLTGISKNLVNQMVSNGWSEGNVMGQYAAKIVFTAFDQFEWGTNTGTWNTFYTMGRETQNLVTIAETTNNDSYKAVALILNAWTFQIATDIWGDIPYSEALKGKTEGINTPVYDKQADVYAALITNLETANTLLSNTTTAVKGDIIFNGDLLKWQKLGNSLRLRLLIRMTNVSDSPVNIAAKIKEIVSNPSANPVIETNSDNALLVYTSSAPNVHPLSTQAGHRIGSYDEYRMSETAEKIMKASNDPRQEVFYAPTENSVVAGSPAYSGMLNGVVDGSAYEYKGGPANISKINPQKFYYSANAAHGIIMLASEVYFTIAEAAIRYPEVAAVADAKTSYEKAIQLNFDYWGKTMPADFLTRQSLSADYNVPVAFDNNIETVINQKWIALFYTDFQGFIEYKRTGFPRLIKPGPDAQKNVYPSRFLYPTSEQALNGDNRDKAVNNQAGSVADYSYWTPVWWERK
jgi:hypothetical protein